MSAISREVFLKTSAGTAALALAPRPLQAAQPAGHLNDIDHFILLMQENRSFDHYFGTLSGVRGYGDTTALMRADGSSVFRQPDPLNPAGFVLPFHLDTSRTNAQRLNDLSHAWDAQHDSLNGGKMDGWVTTHRARNGTSGPLTMGYYTRADLPFYHALADAFTICDAYHCSVLGPTYPNRLYYMSATIDPSGAGGGPVLNNNALDGNITYAWETYPERLERAGISWQIYYDMFDDYFLNVLPYFKPFRAAPPSSPLYNRSRRGRPFDQFLQNVRTGNLPQVTWIMAHAEACEHPDYLPAAGENYVRTILEALWSNPAVWARTAFILMYDENDGLFDHVVPPLPEPGTPGEFVGGRPIGLGFRVPCLVVSPYARGGYVCSDTFDHTSILRLLEARFGVEVPNLTAWRRATCGDLTSAFAFDQPPQLDVPVFPETSDRLASIYEALPTLPPPAVPATQQLPMQEPGRRPRR
ncbi:MAG TPA: alkaline phosphatase family protein [Candidatus Acidoferrales bacterium]|nr:alkaline phosphatase family protein [Candidatus Acidoferrales bacterium]